MNSITAALKKHYFIFLSFLLFASSFSFGATLKGKLVDEESQPLIGASIQVLNTKLYAITGLDGSYTLKDVPAGNYHLLISFIGYESLNKTITVKSSDKVLILNYQLKPAQTMLGEAEVKATAINGTEVNARMAEKNSESVVSAISAKTIELSPDITVANVVQRVSGVSLERNSNGDPQYAILRGMDKRYNYTLVNGIKIPSPNNANRYVPLDIFPAEMLDRLDVHKSLTPSMEGDAIGGAVNLILKDAPQKFSLSTNLQLGYNQIFLNRNFYAFDHKAVNYITPWEINGPKYQATMADFSTANGDINGIQPIPDILAGISVGNRFFKKRLGVMLAGSFQNSYRGTNSTWFSTETDLYGSNNTVLNSRQDRQYSEQQKRLGLHFKTDYLLNDNNKISLYSAYFKLSNYQVRTIFDTKLDSRLYNPDSGNAILQYRTRTHITDQAIFNTTLQGEHQLAQSFRIQWSAVYSKATQDQPDELEFIRNGELKHFVEQPQTIEIRNPRMWRSNSDRDYSGYLNFYVTPKFIGKKGEISFGGLYRKKDRINFYNQYQFNPEPAVQTQGVDWNQFSDVSWKIINPSGSTFNSLNYKAHENIAAGYLQFKFLVLKKLQIITGARAENTDQGYSLYFPTDNQQPDFTQKYTDLLPSLNLKYMPTEHINVRASYYKAISRPGYFEIVPYHIINDDDYDEYGNPGLKKVKADNLDLRFEYFPTGFDQFLAGAFYKKIQDPIEYALVQYGARSEIVVQPGNYGTAYNWGLEFDLTKYFNRFGIKANYTFTKSQITSLKSISQREDPSDTTSQLILKQVYQTRPLEGQSPHVANFSLLYKDSKRGLDAQVTMVYTGERIATLSPFLDNDYWQKPFTRFDVSVEKTLGKFEIFLKARNIFNSPYELFVKRPINSNKSYDYQENPTQETLVRRDYYYQSYRIGVRYKF